MRIKPEARKTIKRKKKKKKQYTMRAHKAVAAIELNNFFLSIRASRIIIIIE